MVYIFKICWLTKFFALCASHNVGHISQVSLEQEMSIISPSSLDTDFVVVDVMLMEENMSTIATHDACTFHQKSQGNAIGLQMLAQNVRMPIKSRQI